MKLWPFHRHRWALHSHTITDTFFGFGTFFSASVLLECRHCGKRRLVKCGVNNYMTVDKFQSREEAMIWIRSLVTEPVPGTMPNFEEPVRKEAK